VRDREGTLIDLPQSLKQPRGGNMRQPIYFLVVCIATILFPLLAAAQTKEDGIRIAQEAIKLDRTARNIEDLEKAAEKYEQALRIVE
jgi:hypothetical protein